MITVSKYLRGCCKKGELAVEKDIAVGLKWRKTNLYQISGGKKSSLLKRHKAKIWFRKSMHFPLKAYDM